MWAYERQYLDYYLNYSSDTVCLSVRGSSSLLQINSIKNQNTCNTYNAQYSCNHCLTKKRKAEQ